MKLFILIIFLSGCTSSQVFTVTTYTEDDYSKLSIKEIIDNPNKYNNKPIELYGYFYHGLEYTSIADKKYSDPVKSVWISFNFKEKLLNKYGENLLEENRLEDYSGKRIKIKGVFTKDKKGHLGIYAGTLTSITYFGDEK